jgi:hypothetical protein
MVAYFEHLKLGNLLHVVLVCYSFIACASISLDKQSNLKCDSKLFSLYEGVNLC